MGRPVSYTRPRPVRGTGHGVEWQIREARVHAPRLVEGGSRGGTLGVSVDFFEDHVMHEIRVVRLGRRRLVPVKELVRSRGENAGRPLGTNERASKQTAARWHRGAPQQPVLRRRLRKMLMPAELPGRVAAGITWRHDTATVPESRGWPRIRPTRRQCVTSVYGNRRSVSMCCTANGRAHSRGSRRMWPTATPGLTDEAAPQRRPAQVTAPMPSPQTMATVRVCRGSTRPSSLPFWARRYGGPSPTAKTHHTVNPKAITALGGAGGWGSTGARAFACVRRSGATR
jgi:hypothetical protein